MCVPSVGASHGNTEKVPRSYLPDFFIFPRRDNERCRLLDPRVASADLIPSGDVTYPRKTGEGDVDLLKRCRYRSLPIKKVELLLDTENLPQETLVQPKQADSPVRSLVFALCDEDFVWRRQLFDEVEMWMREHNDWHDESSVSIQSVVDYLLQQQPSSQEGEEDADEDLKALLRHNLHKNLRKFIRREDSASKQKRRGSAVFARLQYRRKRRGTGAFGTVFDGDVEVRIRGLPPLLRNLAVKEVFNEEKEPSWAYLRNMIREHRGMTRVRYHVAPQSCERHHLMQPISSFLGLTGAWLLMEAVTGADLGSVLTVGKEAHGHQEKCLNLVQIRSCMRDIVEALAKLEEKRLCHLDVKPENVMVHFPRKNTNEIICKLIDYGFVVDLNYQGPWMGTRKYSPPECWQDSDSSSGFPVMETGRGYDSWSAGVLMFELLTGDWQTALRIFRSKDAHAFEAEMRLRLNLEDWVKESMQMLARSAIPCSLRGAAGRIRQIFQGAFALVQRLLWEDRNERLTPKQAKYFRVNFLYDDALYDALSESERAIVPAEVAEHCQVRHYLERFWGNVIERHQRNLLGQKSSEIHKGKAKAPEPAESTTSEEMPFVSDLEASSDNESGRTSGSDG